MGRLYYSRDKSWLYAAKWEVRFRMIELKIICYCALYYKFDVEPVNGQMPFTVKTDSPATRNAGAPAGRLWGGAPVTARVKRHRE